MKKLFLLAALVYLTSCNKEENSPINAGSNHFTLKESGFENRFEYFENDINNDDLTRSAASFSHIANVSAPILKDTLSATGMEIDGKYCYVTYHNAGAAYGGAIEVFDISNPLKPTIVSQLLFEDADINECTINQGKLYAVGGRNIYTSDFTENNTRGAVMVEIPLKANKLSTELKWMPLPSYSGNSVAAYNNFLYVVAGNTEGGVFKINQQSLKIMDSDLFSNARYCDVDKTQKKGNIVVLQGSDNPQINEYTINSNFKTSKQSYTAPQSVTPNGKSVVCMDNTDVFVCTGEKALMVYSLNNLSNPYKTILSTGSGFANGVHCDKDYVYAANGIDGVSIYDRSSFALNTTFKFNGSANYIQSSGTNIFVSNGKGGLKILRKK